MIRTFIAIKIPENIRKLIDDFQKSLRCEHFPVRWIAIENMHLTLKFIGEIPSDTVDAIKNELFEAPPIWKPFEITISGTGVFPNIRKVRIFWIGITNGSEELIKLVNLIESHLTKFNIKKEKRPFKPHLTIGRCKIPRHLKGLEQFVSRDIFYAGSFVVNEIIFMKSVLRPTGAEYTPLAVHSLAP